MPVSGNQLMKEAVKAGWKVLRQKGSHVRLEKDGRKITIPVHGKKDLGKGLEAKLRKELGL